MGAHACVVLARARFVVRHLADQILGRHAGDVGGFRMALAGHQMARAASKPDALAAGDRSRRGGVFVGKPVRRSSVAGDLGGVVFLRAAGHLHDAFRLHGARLDLVGDVERPVGESRRHFERFLRVGRPHHEERSHGAHEDGDADGRVFSEDAADHGGSPLHSHEGLPFSTKSAGSCPGEGNDVHHQPQDPLVMPRESGHPVTPVPSMKLCCAQIAVRGYWIAQSVSPQLDATRSADHRAARPGDPVNTDRAYWIARVKPGDDSDWLKRWKHDTSGCIS